MKNKRVLTSIIIVAVIAFGWFYTHRTKAVQYTTTKVTRGSIISLISATGTLNPVGNTTIDSASGTVTGGVTVGAQVNGRIMKVNVGFGSHVKQGQVLAEIDPTTYQADVESAQADLMSAQASILKASSAKQTAQAQLQKDQANYINAQKTYERNQILWQKNFIAKGDLDTAEATFESAKAQVQADRTLIASAQDDIAAAQAVKANKTAALQKAATNLSYTKILAPVDGLVIAGNTAVGQTVVSSFQSPNLFVIAKSLKTMQIDTLVDEADIPKIKLNQTAKFNIDSYPTETFTGTVAQIRNNPITQQNVVNYDVIVYVPNPDEKFLPGMTANVNFVIDQRNNVLEIPNRALLFVPPTTAKSANASAGGGPSSAPSGFSSGSPGSRGGGHHRKVQTPQVWILANKTPQPQPVTLGISDGSMTEVLSGLSEGEEVIVGIAGAQKAKANPFSTF